MASTGEIFPTAAASVSEAPWSDNTWSSPTNILTDNAAYASVTATSYDSPDQTFVLKATGFNLSAVGPNDTIDGVIVRIQGRDGGGGASWDLVQLLNASGAKVGTNKASPAVPIAASDTVYTFGTSSDLWGNALTPAWVTDADFGVAIGALAVAANAQVFIDYVTVEVFYTVGEPPSVSASAGLASGTGNTPNPDQVVGVVPIPPTGPFE